MKVLLVGAASSVHVMRWANAFAQRNLRVHVATQHDPAPGYVPSVVMHRLPHWGGAGYVLGRSALRSIVRAVRPDVMNAHYASGYGTLAVREPDVPLVLNVWGSDVYEFPDKSRWHHKLLCRNLLRADRVVSTSEVMAHRTKTVCPTLDRITVVPFGVDMDRFTPRQVHAATSGVVVGTVKTLAPKYGIDTLIRAFERYLHFMPSDLTTTLRIVGKGPQREALEALAFTLGCTSRIRFVGAVPHEKVPDELRSMDVFVALSRADSESFGVAVIEAGACGLPVLVSDVGGLPEVVADGVTGRIVPHDDVEAAAHALVDLITDASLRKQWGASARERVATHYSWDRCVDRMIAVLEEARHAADRT